MLRNVLKNQVKHYTAQLLVCARL